MPKILFFNVFNMTRTEVIECALCPNLYPYQNLGQSILSTTTDLVIKSPFRIKCALIILDYALHYDLLQFHYVCSLYKVVSRAINKPLLNFLPTRALDNKTFSATYRRQQHHYLLHAADQFGLPHVF